MNINGTDLRILQIIQEDAGLGHKQIAAKACKSVTTVTESIRRMKDRGYIRRIVAILDRKKIDRNLVAFSQVLLSDHTAGTLADFERQIKQFPEVMECFQMAGAFDFILRIATSDMDAYYDFYRNRLSTLPNINTVQSFFVLSEAKSVTAYPI